MKKNVTLQNNQTLSFEFERKKIKNINLRVKGNGEVFVSAPFYMPYSIVQTFIISKTSFIEKALKKSENRVKNPPALCSEDELKMKVLDMCDRIYPIFKEMGVSYPKEIKFRKMKNTWGSCRASSGILTFNKRLNEKPDEFIEYVVIHEFSHFVHPNHSKDFWSLMTKLMPDWKERRDLK